MTALSIAILVYLGIGVIVASIVVFNAGAWRSIEEFTYQYPIPASKPIWFVMLTLFWVILICGVSIRRSDKSGVSVNVKFDDK